MAALWACGFYRQGCEVFVITKTSDRQVYALDEGIQVLPYYPEGGGRVSKILGGVRLIRSYCRRWRPDVVIGVMNVASMMGWMATRGLHIPVIATEHNAFEKPEYAHTGWFDRFTKFQFNRLYPLVTVLTDADRRFVGNWLRNIRVLPNPLALKPVEELPQKERIILAAGRIDEWHCKGFDLLIKAFGKLVREQGAEGWQLHIAGTGSEANMRMLRDLCSQEGIGERVRFLGFRKDIESLYRQAGVFVLSSRYEGFGMVLIEAMSQGCACIACDYKGRQREIITSDDEGIICPVDDVDALADAMRRLTVDAALRRRLQEGAVERSKEYGLQKIMERWKEILVGKFR